MNEVILHDDGIVTVVGDVGSVAGVMAKIGTQAVEVTREELKTHGWRLPRARAERLQEIRILRNARLLELDREANHASTGRPGQRPGPAIENDRQVLRDLPPTAEAALELLNNTDDITTYTPDQLV